MTHHPYRGYMIDIFRRGFAGGYYAGVSEQKGDARGKRIYLSPCFSGPGCKAKAVSQCKDWIDQEIFGALPDGTPVAKSE